MVFSQEGCRSAANMLYGFDCNIGDMSTGLDQLKAMDYIIWEVAATAVFTGGRWVVHYRGHSEWPVGVAAAAAALRRRRSLQMCSGWRVSQAEDVIGHGWGPHWGLVMRRVMGRRGQGVRFYRPQGQGQREFHEQGKVIWRHVGLWTAYDLVFLQPGVFHGTQNPDGLHWLLGIEYVIDHSFKFVSVVGVWHDVWWDGWR